MEEAAGKVIPVAAAEVHRVDHLTGVAVRHVVAPHVVIPHVVATAVVAAGAEHLIVAAMDHPVDQEGRPGAGLLQCQAMKSGVSPAKEAKRRMEVAVAQDLHHAVGGKYS